MSCLCYIYLNSTCKPINLKVCIFNIILLDLEQTWSFYKCKRKEPFLLSYLVNNSIPWEHISGGKNQLV